jgi:molecular chaperone DnaJ
MADLYEVLEVARSADGAEIKRSYRRLVRDCHPDLNPGPAAELRFKAVSRAYAVLSDPTARALYDEFGDASLEAGFDPIMTREASRQRQSRTSSPFGDLNAFHDAFAAAFNAEPDPEPEPWGRGGRASTPEPTPEDGEYNHAPPPFMGADFFSGAFSGGATSRSERAQEARGGRAARSAPSDRGGFPGERAASTTGTWGYTPPGAAPRADATGPEHLTASVPAMTAILGGLVTVEVRRPDGRLDGVRVRVRPGASSGDVVELKGAGPPREWGAPPTDLSVTLDIEDHPHLRRNGDDLELDCPVTLNEAVHGGPINVPTPTGPARVNLPPNCAGKKLRLRGRGVQREGRPGHLILHLRIALPDRVSSDALELFRKLESAYDGDLRDRLKM